ncbi:alginate O-acetyltransferase AlgX-related protein [Enterobacter hormaechei]|uniref:alginate O-acetyltransferase AlgX-related protein n=1 Tax=Enterobacter hormaechei TaxID=158836 RepID=UPI00123A42D2|nr:hypothetical protein [Enterobacter hormaechei]
MKCRLRVFVVIVFISLLIVPAINLTLGRNAMPKSFPETFKKLYNLDIIESFIGYAGYAIGMSSDPGKVVVGHDGWLFLGDDISSPITTKIRGVDDKINSTINAIHNNMYEWNNFFKRCGVKEFRVIIGPDKDSVYSEKTPAWNRQSDKKILKTLTAGQNLLFVNTYDAFKIAKSKFIMPMYFHTDTHWNELGAVVAFSALVKTLDGSDLNFHAEPTENDFYLKLSRAGDLAAFLRINKFIEDQVVLHKDKSIDNLIIKKYDFESGKLISKSKFSQIGAPSSPVLFISNGALNNVKVLWLRDSFGTAMSPFMVQAFKETLQVHYGKVDASTIKNLVKAFRPDYVFITGVERDALSAFYRKSL